MSAQAPRTFDEPVDVHGSAVGDAADSYEVRRESVIAMLERERRSLTSSLFALALFAAAIAFLPDARFMFGLLVLRVTSFVITRRAVTSLEFHLRERNELAWAERRLTAAMAGTGLTLALMMWPQPTGAPIAAIVATGGVSLVTLVLISVTLAALPAPRDAMLASFLATISAIILFHPSNPPIGLVLVFAVAAIGIRVYSHNTGQHIVSSAEILVENRRLSEELADALAHAEFLSWRDPMTGLFNRRKLFEERSVGSGGGSRHLLMVDLDHFKTINDQFGHAAGDHVLIATSNAVRSRLGRHTRDRLLAFRLGGEEFLIILDHLDCGQARVFAEDLRTDIAAISHELAGRYPGIAVTASIGLARWHEGEALDDVLQRSDLACYQAKDAGRNVVRDAA